MTDRIRDAASSAGLAIGDMLVSAAGAAVVVSGAASGPSIAFGGAPDKVSHGSSFQITQEMTLLQCIWLDKHSQL